MLDETGLLPHVNPGADVAADIALLRPVAPSMGIMLETASDRLSERAARISARPTSCRRARLETIRIAGECAVPFTTGILIGIGETRRERIDALLALRDLHERYGHIQEIIVQNFRAKPGTKMARRPEPSWTICCWTIAVARMIFGPEMSIQAPPNLTPASCRARSPPASTTGAASRRSRPITSTRKRPGRISSGWPRETERAGQVLVERLTIYPRLSPARRDGSTRRCTGTSCG